MMRVTSSSGHATRREKHPEVGRELAADRVGEGLHLLADRDRGGEVAGPKQ